MYPCNYCSVNVQRRYHEYLKRVCLLGDTQMLVLRKSGVIKRCISYSEHYSSSLLSYTLRSMYRSFIFEICSGAPGILYNINDAIYPVWSRN